MDGYIVIFSTVSSENEARKIAEKLVGARLAACVNIIKGVSSVYTWKDKLCFDDECLIIIKTREELFEKICIEIKKYHSYELPEIISLKINKGLDKYLDWIGLNTQI